MAIDLYFVGTCKEFVSIPNAKEISFGWGIDQIGKLRRPAHWLKDVPILIDDSITAKITDAFLQELLPYCQKGCILDFERKISRFHLLLLQFLKHNHIHPLWIPAMISKYAENPLIMALSDLPHNSWQNFCAAQKSLYGKSWVLEYHPLNIHHSSVGQTQIHKPVFLENAMCMAYNDGTELHYYDTIATITEKFKIAEEYGCRGILTIASEWKNIK